MARRRSRRRERKQRRTWVIIGVVVAAILIIGILIAVTAGSGAPIEIVETDYEGLVQERVEINDAPGFALGDPDAPVTIIEYSDFSCPHCFDLADQAIHPIIDEYVETGQARIIFKPVSFVNPPYSRPAAQAAICAGEQGKFWELHDQIWVLYDASGPGAYTQGNLASLAEEIGLDANEFRSCFVSADTNQEVQAVVSETQVIGVTGTPSLFVNGESVGYRGPQAAYGDLKLAIEAIAGQ